MTYVKSVVRNYPVLCRKLEKLRETTGKADGTGVHGNGFSRPVEALVLRELPAEEQRELDAVRRAIELTETQRNGDLRLKLIDMVYWTDPRPLNAAADRLFIGYRTAKNYNREFLEAVRAALGGGG